MERSDKKDMGLGRTEGMTLTWRHRSRCGGLEGRMSIGNCRNSSCNKHYVKERPGVMLAGLIRQCRDLSPAFRSLIVGVDARGLGLFHLLRITVWGNRSLLLIVEGNPRGIGISCLFRMSPWGIRRNGPFPSSHERP